MAPESPTLTGKTSSPTDDATAWMTPNWAIAEGLTGREVPPPAWRDLSEQLRPFPHSTVFE